MTVYVRKLDGKLMTDPELYFSINLGLSVDPPTKDILKGHEDIIIIIF
jgi:hypothetical protein